MWGLVNIHNAFIFLLHDITYISFTAHTIYLTIHILSLHQLSLSTDDDKCESNEKEFCQSKMKSVCFTAYNQNPLKMMKTMCTLWYWDKTSTTEREWALQATRRRRQRARQNPCNPILLSVARCLMMIKTHKIDVIYLVSEVDDGWGGRGGEGNKISVADIIRNDLKFHACNHWVIKNARREQRRREIPAHTESRDGSSIVCAHREYDIHDLLIHFIWINFRQIKIMLNDDRQQKRANAPNGLLYGSNWRDGRAEKKQKKKVDFVIYGRKIKLFTNKHK